MLIPLRAPAVLPWASLYSLPFLIFLFQVIYTSQEEGEPKLWAAVT